MKQADGGVALELEPEDEDLEPAPNEGLEPPESGGEGEEEEVPVTVEDRARAMGWHPLSEYRGDPRRWVQAAEFVKRGENELPILRDQNRRMSEKLARMEPQIAEIPALKSTITEMKAVLEDMRRLGKTADERGYKRALADLEEKRKDAVAAGDTATFEAVDAQIGELRRGRAESPEPAPEPPAPTPAAAMPAEIAAFARQNPWWNTDKTLSECMITMHGLVMTKFPDMPLGQQLDEALKRVKAEYSDYFEIDEEEPTMPANPPPARPPARAAAVARPSPPVPPGRRAPSGFDRITDPADRAEAKAAYARAKRQMPDLSEAEWLNLYEDPHADVLSLRSQRRA